MDILLIGAGNMGGALYKAWHKNHQITVVENNPTNQQKLKDDFPQIVFTNNTKCDGLTVVLAVKPQSINSVKLIGKAKTIISIMAGVELNTIKSAFNAENFVRAMPNMAAKFAMSATALTGDIDAKDAALDLFNLAGSAVWLAGEKELNIATALAGSGPGYLAIVAEAMANSAVMLGLKSDEAHALTAALFSGTGSLLAHTHPALLKEQVSSPAGTTAAGVAALEKHGIRHAFYEAIRSAYAKALELSKRSEDGKI